MRIQVRLFATLRQYGPPGEEPFPLEVEEGALVGHVLETLGIPAEVQKVILLNGRHAKVDDRVDDGDVLTLFPPVEGG